MKLAESTFLILVLFFGIPTSYSSEWKESDLFGSWFLTDENGSTVTIHFRKDAIFDGQITMPEYEPFEFSGTWKMEGNELFYHYTKPEPPGDDVDIILLIEHDSFTIQAKDGEKRTYKRIAKKLTKLNQSSHTTPASAPR